MLGVLLRTSIEGAAALLRAKVICSIVELGVGGGVCAVNPLAANRVRGDHHEFISLSL